MASTTILRLLSPSGATIYPLPLVSYPGPSTPPSWRRSGHSCPHNSRPHPRRLEKSPGSTDCLVLSLFGARVLSHHRSLLGPQQGGELLVARRASSHTRPVPRILPLPCVEVSRRRCASVLRAVTLESFSCATLWKGGSGFFACSNGAPFATRSGTGIKSFGCHCFRREQPPPAVVLGFYASPAEAEKSERSHFSLLTPASPAKYGRDTFPRLHWRHGSEAREGRGSYAGA